MAQQTSRTSAGNRAVARLFSSPSALAYLRRAVARGEMQAEARKRYLVFVNRCPAPRSARAA
jgi:hypothetical protein